MRLPELIGLSRALDLILTGRIVEAEEAHLMGLVYYVTKPGTGIQFHKSHNFVVVVMYNGMAPSIFQF